MANIIYQLPVWETVTTAWHQVKGAKKSIWAAVGFSVLVMFTLGFIEGICKVELPTLRPVVAFLSKVINYLLQMGILYIGIKRALGFPITYRLMLRAFEISIMIRIIGLYILQALICIIPVGLAVSAFIIYSQQNSFVWSLVSILLFIAALGGLFYLFFRLIISNAFVLDQGINPWQAIKLSFQATRSNFWRVVAIFMIQILVLVISVIPLGIGLIWSIPFVTILSGMLYKNLLHNTT